MRMVAMPSLFVLSAVALVLAQTPGARIQSSQIPNAGAARQPANPAQAATPENTQTAPPSTQDTSIANSAAGIDRVDAGTEVRAALDTPLSTRISKPGDRFTAAITDPVRANSWLRFVTKARSACASAIS
jgi:hypothetical protein